MDGWPPTVLPTVNLMCVTISKIRKKEEGTSMDQGVNQTNKTNKKTMMLMPGWVTMEDEDGEQAHLNRGQPPDLFHEAVIYF